MYYVLDGKQARLTSNVIEWARWFSTANRRVARDEVGDVEVSTVFLGTDHSFGGTPLLFETMVFGGPLDQEQERYPDWDSAEAGHKRMVERVRVAGGDQ